MRTAVSVTVTSTLSPINSHGTEYALLSISTVQCLRD
jgi:hypothetical protein